MSSTCPIFRIPGLCNPCIITNSATYVGNVMVTPPTYAANAAPMAIGKLQADIPSYDPSNQQLQVYEFTAADVTAIWAPTVYQISGGVIKPNGVTSGGINTSGGEICTTTGYNTATPEYTLVTWYDAANHA